MVVSGWPFVHVLHAVLTVVIPLQSLQLPEKLDRGLPFGGFLGYGLRLSRIPNRPVNAARGSGGRRWTQRSAAGAVAQARRRLRLPLPPRCRRALARPALVGGRMQSTRAMAERAVAGWAQPANLSRIPSAANARLRPSRKNASLGSGRRGAVLGSSMPPRCRSASSSQRMPA